MNRRTLMLAAPALLGSVRARAQKPTLRNVARRAGLLIGSASEIDLASDPAYAALIADNCSLFAPNMSWQRMSPTPTENFAGLDANIGFAQQHGLSLTGYHLLWHQRLPDWFDALDRGAAERAIEEHVAAIGSRFGPQTASWNVVNEAIRPADGMPGGLRRSPLLEKFGTAFFDIAFYAAQRAAPRALRLYNDYDLELDTTDEQTRRRALLGLIDELLRRSVPIQAIGLQSHLRTRSFDRFDPVEYRRFLNELADRNLDIFITELDVHDLATGDLSARDSRIADIYARFLDTALSQPRVGAVVFWGLSDRYSWLNDPTRSNYARPDGLPGRPLPFDTDLHPKSAFNAIERAMASAPQRHR
ncbi:MAG: endo-1,4-beta-xylanase [Janthinobacterium lividum]